jgi:hypothetical protein
MKTRIHAPTPRTPDSALLGRLREIDPDADLVYLGEGTWALGVVAPVNTARRKNATVLMRKFWSAPEEKRKPAILRLASAAQQGFRVVSQYVEADLHSGYMIQDFCIADSVYRAGRDAAYQALEDACDEEPDEDVLKATALYQARDAWHYAMKGRKHFIQKTGA